MLGRDVEVEGERVLALEHGWEAIGVAADSLGDPRELDDLDLSRASVPGTAASVVMNPGDAELARDLDAEDWWFRTRFDFAPLEPGEEATLELDGIATVAEVFLNGELILESHSMFARHAIDVGEHLAGSNELAIRCRALAPLLAERRRPRARWRTRVVEQANLRFFRTMLLGRAAGFAPGPPTVGPWRPIRIRHRRQWALEELHLRTGLEHPEGRLAVRARFRTLAGSAPESVEIEVEGRSGPHRASLELEQLPEGRLLASGDLRIADVERWWPHTHGDPALYEVALEIETGGESRRIEAGNVGFRSVAAGPGPDHDIETDGLDLHLNGVAIFARGAVWTTPDPVGLAPSRAQLRRSIELAREAGLNILRIPGTGAYESGTFHDLCDELGMLVWQDFMFANFDYPLADDGFREIVEAEATQIASELTGRASTVVFCGNSEVEQQAAMFGAGPEAGRGALFYELLPGVLESFDSDAVYVPSAPFGGNLPFRPDRGLASYFGVGGYRRPLGDVRRADVRFAAECLAFANVPAPETLVELFGVASTPIPHHPAWKSGVPRDLGTGWDFDDVRDHYLELLYGVDPVSLRSVDPERYLELSRAVSGEVMAEVFGEWRRAGSSCAGGIALWWQDRRPGAGWGLRDSAGRPKAALQYLSRALAPVATWFTDEGLGGLSAHIANDRAEPLRARLVISVYRNFEQLVGQAAEELELAPRSTVTRDVEAMLERFCDASWAYRFGPPAQDLIVSSLQAPGAEFPTSRSFFFPAGRPTGQEAAGRIGLEAEARAGAGGTIEVSIRTRRMAYGLHLDAPGFTPSQDWFSLEPGGEATLRLQPLQPQDRIDAVMVRALNLEGAIRVPCERPGREHGR